MQKDVRVVEEIGVKKEATDRTETVRDTVRKTEVDVEDTSATTRPAGAATTSTSTVKGGSMGTGGQTTNPTAGATSSGTNAPRK